MAIYGYCRVSGYAQELYGSGLDSQKDCILQKYPTAEIYSESYTGMKVERPEFAKVIHKLKAGDTFVVCKLDRFSRTAADGAKLIQELVSRQVTVDILNMGVVDGTPMGKLMVTMLLAFAEFEHDMILERMNTGKAHAAAQGKRTCGRLAKSPVEFESCYNEVLSATMTVAEACNRLEICKSTWYKLVRDKSTRKTA